MAKQLSNIIRAGSGSIPLPISLGGTGLAASGTSGNILVSNGTSWSSSSLPTASDTVKGAVKVDNSTITINGSGVISATGFLPVAGGTLTGLLTTKELALTKTAPTISTNTLTIDCSTGNTFAVSLNAAITTITVSNIPATGSYFEFNLEFTADGTARAVTWTFGSTAVKWPTGTAPTLTSTNSKKDVFTFYTYDAGTTWLGFVVGQNL